MVDTDLTRLLLALLLSGCGGCGVLLACPLGPRTADTDTASGGAYTSAAITNGFSQIVTVIELPLKGYCKTGPPLQPPPRTGWQLQPGQTTVFSGALGACTEVAMQVTWKNQLLETCSYTATESNGGVAWAAYPEWTGGDTSCSLAQNAPESGVAIDYEASL
jgi:hypothetical protein